MNESVCPGCGIPSDGPCDWCQEEEVKRQMNVKLEEQMWLEAEV